MPLPVGVGGGGVKAPAGTVCALEIVTFGSASLARSAQVAAAAAVVVDTIAASVKNPGQAIERANDVMALPRAAILRVRAVAGSRLTVLGCLGTIPDPV